MSYSLYQLSSFYMINVLNRVMNCKKIIDNSKGMCSTFLIGGIKFSIYFVSVYNCIQSGVTKNKNKLRCNHQANSNRKLSRPWIKKVKLNDV